MSRASIPSALVLVALAAACTGGGGGLEGEQTTWSPGPQYTERSGSTREAAPGSVEHATDSRDVARESAESAPGAGGGAAGGGIDCSATYTCTSTSSKGTQTGTLTGCKIQVDKDSALTFDPNGSIALDGEVIGTYTPTASGFTVTIEGVTVTCTKD